MCQSVKFLAVVLILAEIKCDSTEDMNSYTLNGFYAPSTLTFQDVFTNNVANTGVGEEDGTSTTEDSNINSIQTQFVEFHPRMTTQGPTLPPPEYIANSNMWQEPIKQVESTSTTTEDPEEIKVVPIKKVYQRGVLDLLFPPRRVKAFKNVFDSIRRALSHTFRR